MNYRFYYHSIFHYGLCDNIFILFNIIHFNIKHYDRVVTLIENLSPSFYAGSKSVVVGTRSSLIQDHRNYVLEGPVTPLINTKV